MLFYSVSLFMILLYYFFQSMSNICPRYGIMMHFEMSYNSFYIPVYTRFDLMLSLRIVSVRLDKAWKALLLWELNSTSWRNPIFQSDTVYFTIITAFFSYKTCLNAFGNEKFTFGFSKMSSWHFVLEKKNNPNIYSCIQRMNVCISGILL